MEPKGDDPDRLFGQEDYSCYENDLHDLVDDGPVSAWSVQDLADEAERDPHSGDIESQFEPE